MQYREVQGHESPLFLTYFDLFQVQAGGAETGFRHVTPETYRTRLLQVKGVRNKLVVREMPKTYKSLNSGDVFILDAGYVDVVCGVSRNESSSYPVNVCRLSIYQWAGSQSSGQEKHKAAEFANNLASERKSGKVSVFGILFAGRESEVISFYLYPPALPASLFSIL